MIYPYKEKKPKIASSAFIADYVTITGDVYVGEESSIWLIQSSVVMCHQRSLETE